MHYDRDCTSVGTEWPFLCSPVSTGARSVSRCGQRMSSADAVPRFREVPVASMPRARRPVPQRCINESSSLWPVDNRQSTTITIVICLASQPFLARGFLCLHFFGVSGRFFFCNPSRGKTGVFPRSHAAQTRNTNEYAPPRTMQAMQVGIDARNACAAMAGCNRNAAPVATAPVNSFLDPPPRNGPID